MEPISIIHIDVKNVVNRLDWSSRFAFLILKGWYFRQTEKLKNKMIKMSKFLVWGFFNHPLNWQFLINSEWINLSPGEFVEDVGSPQNSLSKHSLANVWIRWFLNVYLSPNILIVLFTIW